MRILRTATVCLLFTAFFFTGSYGQSKQMMTKTESLISLDVKQKNIEEVVRLLSEMGGKNIILSKEVENLEIKVTMNLVDVTWRRALNEIVNKYDLYVESEHDNIIKVDRMLRVTFEFDGAVISEVLDSLALFAGKSIILDPKVAADSQKIRLRFKNVPFHVAMEQIVKAYGYVSMEDSFGIIRITTKDHLEQTLETKIVRLAYMRPGQADYVPQITTPYAAKQQGANVSAEGVTAEKTLEGEKTSTTSNVDDFPVLQVLAKMKSSYGSISYNKLTNSLIITDLPEKVKAMVDMIHDLDKRPYQILVSVKIVDIDASNSTKFGIDWVNGLNISAAPGNITDLPFPFELGSDGWEDSIASGEGPAQVTNPYTNGYLNFSQTQLVLNALRSYADGKIVQQPQIVTLDNQEATIHVGQIVRFAEFQSSSTSSSTQSGYVEAANSPINEGVQLLVIPHVTEVNDDIMLTAIPKTDTLLGFDEFGNVRLPRTTSKTIVTRMIIKDGMTGVIGGLRFNRDTVSENRVPLLGKMPGLGYLFKSKSRDFAERELMIFVTPKILEDAKTDNILEEIESIKSEAINTALNPAETPEEILPVDDSEPAILMSGDDKEDKKSGKKGLRKMTRKTPKRSRSSNRR